MKDELLNNAFAVAAYKKLKEETDKKIDQALAFAVELQEEIELKEGPQGPKGDRGEQGPAGKDGINGKDGLNGLDGRDGVDGKDGDVGPQGEIGPKGDKGDKGETGERGEQGLRGETGAVGPKGEKGGQGQRGERGEPGPRGEKGEKGDRGDVGPKGDKGDSGRDGLDGKDGVDGQDGRDGIDGKDGLDGKDGRDGRDGVDGKDGRDGIDGKDGETPDVKPIIDKEITRLASEFNKFKQNAALGGNNTGGGLGERDVRALIQEVGVAATESVEKVVYYGKAEEDITKGDVIMFGGAQGSHILLLKNDMQIPGYMPEMLMGVAETSMLKGEFGNVIQFGKLTPLTTSQWDEGDFLYADPFNPGAFTTTEPTSPQHSILVAAVIYSQNNNGTILIRPTHNEDLEELHDVAITNKQVGDLIQWNGTAWVNTPSNSVVQSYVGDYGDFAANFDAALI